jgi:hypothetical protein
LAIIVTLCLAWFRVASSIVVEVNSQLDSWPIDTDSCLASFNSTQSCSLRNALLFCAQSDEFVDTQCTIELPNKAIVSWNSTFGPVILNLVPKALEIVLNGHNSVVILDSYNKFSSSLLDVNIIDGSIINIDIRNATFTGFTDGVFHFNSVNKLSVRDSTFSNNSGISGGVMHLENTDDVEMDNCVFIENSAHDGGALYLKTQVNYINISSSQFVTNTAALSGGGVFLGTDIRYFSVHASSFLTNR